MVPRKLTNERPKSRRTRPIAAVDSKSCDASCEPNEEGRITEPPLLIREDARGLDVSRVAKRLVECYCSLGEAFHDRGFDGLVLVQRDCSHFVLAAGLQPFLEPLERWPRQKPGRTRWPSARMTITGPFKS